VYCNYFHSFSVLCPKVFLCKMQKWWYSQITCYPFLEQKNAYYLLIFKFYFPIKWFFIFLLLGPYLFSWNDFVLGSWSWSTSEPSKSVFYICCTFYICITLHFEKALSCSHMFYGMLSGTPAFLYWFTIMRLLVVFVWIS
jgi:hypothetical protein